MADIEQTIKHAAKLYEMRDTAKRVLGDRFDRFMEQYQVAIRKVAEHRQCSELQAAMAISKSDADPHVTMFAMAAFVELVEPSAVTPPVGILS